MIAPGRIKAANGIAIIGSVPTLIATAAGPVGQIAWPRNDGFQS